MLQIVEESLSASEPVSVAEIFEAAYRDQAGKDYWRLWLKYERNEGAIGKLLAAHFRRRKPGCCRRGSSVRLGLGSVLPCGPGKVSVGRTRGSLEGDHLR